MNLDLKTADEVLAESLEAMNKDWDELVSTFEKKTGNKLTPDIAMLSKTAFESGWSGAALHTTHYWSTLLLSLIEQTKDR